MGWVEQEVEKGKWPRSVVARRRRYLNKINPKVDLRGHRQVQTDIHTRCIESDPITSHEAFPLSAQLMGRVLFMGDNLYRSCPNSRHTPDKFDPDMLVSLGLNINRMQIILGSNRRNQRNDWPTAPYYEIDGTITRHPPTWNCHQGLKLSIDYYGLEIPTYHPRRDSQGKIEYVAVTVMDPSEHMTLSYEPFKVANVKRRELGVGEVTWSSPLAKGGQISNTRGVLEVVDSHLQRIEDHVATLEKNRLRSVR